MSGINLCVTFYLAITSYWLHFSFGKFYLSQFNMRVHCSKSFIFLQLFIVYNRPLFNENIFVRMRIMHLRYIFCNSYEYNAPKIIMFVTRGVRHYTKTLIPVSKYFARLYLFAARSIFWQHNIGNDHVTYQSIIVVWEKVRYLIDGTSLVLSTKLSVAHVYWLTRRRSRHLSIAILHPPILFNHSRFVTAFC